MGAGGGTEQGRGGCCYTYDSTDIWQIPEASEAAGHLDITGTGVPRVSQAEATGLGLQHCRKSKEAWVASEGAGVGGSKRY